MKKWNLEPMAQTEYQHDNNNKAGLYKGKLVLRPSSIDSYIRCPYSFYQTQILRKGSAPNGASQVGTALHKVMEVALGAQLDTGLRMSVDDMQRAGVREWRDLNAKADIVYHGDQDYASMADDLYAGVLGLNEALDCIVAVGSESRHSVSITDHPLFGAMSGSLDVEIDKGVMDLKFTGKKKSKPDDYIIQQSAYAMLREYNGHVTDDLQILNIVRPTKARKAKAVKNGEEQLVADWHIMEMKPNVAYVEHWMNIILNKSELYAKEQARVADVENGEAILDEYAELLFQGTSPSNSFLCNSTWCSVWSTCPHVADLQEEFDEVELF